MEIKQKTQILKALDKIFTQTERNNTETEILKAEHIFILDPALICGLIPKTDESKILIRDFINLDIHNKKNPSVEYTQEVLKYGCECKYSTQYLKLIINLFECCNESVKISTAHEYPITFENDLFKVILAPRIEN